MSRRPSHQGVNRWLVAVLVPVLLLAGIWLGGHPNDLPGFIRNHFVRDGESRALDDALRIIRRDYYRNLTRGQLVDRSIQGAVASLHDPFSRYLTEREYRDFQREASGRSGFSGVGMTIEVDPRGLKVTGVIPNAPAARQGIRPGDVVVAVDGRSIAHTPARVSTALIRGKPGTFVTLTVLRHAQRRVLRIKRAHVEESSVNTETRKVAGARVLVLRLHLFADGTGKLVRHAAQQSVKRGTKGVVVDLRGNGGGLLEEAVSVASVFIPKGPIVTTAGRTHPRHIYNATGGAIPGRVPVVVLVDHGSASASEIVAGALQDRGRAEVVGSRTFGKGVFQEVEALPNGGALEISVGQYFTPKGRNLGGGGVRRGAGITPDVRAATGVRGGRDKGLDAALRVLARSLG